MSLFSVVRKKDDIHPASKTIYRAEKVSKRSPRLKDIFSDSFIASLTDSHMYVVYNTNGSRQSWYMCNEFEENFDVINSRRQGGH